MIGLVIWLTGLSSSGKTTLARALANKLSAAGHQVTVLDGDEVRQKLSADLGFSPADRDENVRRVSQEAYRLSQEGTNVICALVSPYRQARDEARRLIGEAFIEVYVSTPLEICKQRDVKGLYARFDRGEVAGVTGVDAPYEPPLKPEVTVPTDELSVAEAVDIIWRACLSKVR